MVKRSLSLVVLMSVWAAAPAQQGEPAFVDYKVAGMDLNDYSSIKPSYDKAKGYYLSWGGD